MTIAYHSGQNECTAQYKAHIVKLDIARQWDISVCYETAISSKTVLKALLVQHSWVHNNRFTGELFK
jgi:hypothetical protein